MNRPLWLCAIALTACVQPVAAHANPIPMRVNIAREATANALIELALQAGISIGGDLSACGGTTPLLRGRMVATEALARLLARTRCTFEDVGTRTYRIRLRPPPPWLTAASPAPARPVRRPDAALPPPLAEIVVTAPRRSTLINRAPQAISSISGSQLARTGSSDLSSLAAQIAGLTVTNLGAGRDKILLRGQSDGAFTGFTQSTVPIYLDSLPITYNAPDPDLRLVDVDRVEVLRGPQGSLYGAGSIGGLLRIVTRKPDLDVWAGAFSATSAVTQSGDPSSILEGVINLPVVPGRLAVRLVGYSEREGGWIDDVRLGLSKVNRTSRDGGRVAARLSLTPNWTLSGGITHQSINLADTQYADAAIGELKRANFVREPHDNDFDQAYVTLEGQGDWGKLNGSAEILHHRLDTRYDTTLAAERFSLPPSEPAALDEARRIDLVVAEITLSSPERGPLRWLIGGFTGEGEEAFRASISSLAEGALAYSERRSDVRDELAIYGEVSYEFGHHLTATAGLRAFGSTLKTISIVGQPLLQNGERAFSDRLKTVDATPKLVVSYQASDALLIYGQASQGYRPGGFNTSGLIGQTFAGPRDPGEPARRFSADQLWSYELGAKLKLYDSNVSVRAAAYYATWDSIQTDQFLPSGLPYTVNVGEGIISGVEVEAAWQVTAHLQLRGAGVVDDPQLTRERNTAFPSRSDAGLPGVPGLSFSASADYRRPIGRDLALLANAQFAFVGASNVTFDAETVARVDGYSVAKLRVGLERKGWRLSAFADNLGDARSNTFAFGNPFSFLRTQQVTPLRPRTMGLTLDVGF